MRSACKSLLVASLLASPVPAQQTNLGLPESVMSQASAKATAIVGGTLLDIHTGKEIKNTVVIIRGERIAEVGTADTLTPPNDAQVVDARGKWILPGLIDMHAHLWGWEDSQLVPLGLFLAN